MKTAAHSPIRIRSLFAAALACAFGGFPLQPMAQSSDGPILHNADEIRYFKGRLLVQPRAGLSVQELDKKLKAHGGRRVSTIPRINVHVVELPSRANERAVAKLLSSDRHIKFAEVDEELLPAMTPNDPAYSGSWHLSKIGSPAAWDYSNGDGVIIAILDTGVDATHPELVGNMVPGYNAYDNNSDTRDVYGHGTKVAGAAAMAGNNLIGGTGVAFKSRIMPIRVTSTTGSGSHSAMARGLVWAADNGARVANMSFARVCGSSTIWTAAQYMRNKGGVVIGAAGNSGVQESMSSSDTMTCVAASDGSDAKAGFSSYGAYVDVAAPGVGIYVTTNGGGYGSSSGTSFSAPITGAVYALMMAANRNLSPSQLDDALFSTAADLDRTYFGHGRVDAAAAVAKVRGTSSADIQAPTVSIESPAANENVNGLVAVDVSATDNLGVTRVELYVDSRLVGTDTTAPYSFTWDASAITSGQFSLEAKAFDAANNSSSDHVTLAVGSSQDAAPTVSILNPKAGSTVNGATTVSVTAADDRKVAKITLQINGKEVAASYGETLDYTWDPNAGKQSKGRSKWNVFSTSYTITATATDDAGKTATTSASVTVP